VEISYKSRKLEKQLTEPNEMIKSFGQLARKVNQRLKDLTDADNLAIMRTQKDDGGLNWEEVTKIQMNEIEDYH
jgi:proteic killer suppression protein